MSDDSNATVVLSGFRHSNKWIYITMMVSAFISLCAAFILSNDAVVLAGNKNASLSCNINQVISCGTVGSSWQAHFLGFPTAFLGLIFEPVVITVAIAGLSGVFFKKWFMCGLQFMYFIAICLAYWLFSQSILSIHALCPYCLLVTLTTTLVFFSLLHINIRDNNFSLSPKMDYWAKFLVKVNIDVLVILFLISAIVVIIFISYGSLLFK